MINTSRDCTADAKLVWAKILPNHPWPKGWRVEWRQMSNYGWCSWTRKKITLNSRFVGNPKRDIVETLIHEFVHMHYGIQLRHGIEFRQIQGRWMAKYFGAPRPVHFMGNLYDPVDGKTVVQP